MNTTDRMLFGVPAAADQLDISARTLWDLIRNRELPVVRIGTRTLIDKSDLLAFIDARRDDSGQPRKKARPRKAG